MYDKIDIIFGLFLLIATSAVVIIQVVNAINLIGGLK